jgi:hypothetical protein
VTEKDRLHQELVEQAGPQQEGVAELAEQVSA